MRQIALLAAAAASVLTATALTAAASAAETNEMRSFQASRIQVARACVDFHGVGLMTPSNSGQYGCYTRAGWVTCEENGRCNGARYGHYDKEAPRYVGKPGVEGVLGGLTTRLVPRNDR